MTNKNVLDRFQKDKFYNYFYFRRFLFEKFDCPFLPQNFVGDKYDSITL